MTLKRTPIYEWHASHSAKIADFGGWQMPIEYPTGVLAEHTAVRTAVGLFDVSHLGKISVTGKTANSAKEFLNSQLTNDLTKLKTGGAQYNLLCTESGGVIDDLIVYQRSDFEFLLIPNAANCAQVFAILSTAAATNQNIKLSNDHEKYCVFAVQGPASKKVLNQLFQVPTLEYTQFAEVQITSLPSIKEIILCRTGYTGEFGYEILVSWSEALTLWQRLVDLVTAENGLVCGLGARDTLRTEMGYPLHGHELSVEISPLTAGLKWAVNLKKQDFPGASALRKEFENGSKQKLVGLKLIDRGIARNEMKVFAKSTDDEKVIGTVTSGTFSPTLKNAIALALIDQDAVALNQVFIDVRGKRLAAQIVNLPFVPAKVREVPQ